MEVDEQNKYMTLDEEAIKALDLFETKKLVKTGKSLYNILNRCKTNSGKELLRDWINHPLMDIKDIDKRLNLVEIFFDNNQLRDDVGNCLQRIPDLQKLTKKLTQKKCTLMECCKIYQGFFVLKKLIKVLDSSDNDLIKRNFLNKLKEMDKTFLNYSKLIDGMVDKDSLAAGDPIIDANYDDNLSGLYEEMEVAKKKANKVISIVAKKLNLEVGKTIKLECSPVLGFQMKMTRKYDSLIRGDKSYFVDGTKKDGIRFTTSDLQDCSASYIEKRSEYDENQSKIIEGMVNELRTYCKPLESLIKILSKLDVIYSLADVAKYGSQSYVRPKILEKNEGKILLKGLRHPCLETLTNMYFIPNSIDFDKKAKKFFIVTGPNMGGKSTFLRSIGLAVLLAQIGSFVPADEAIISIVDCIFTRVGASDKQMKGISTFKAEMLETGQILKKATENSLVIIDELGRGTSTYDGFGLAWAISKEIASKIQPYCLFATHFHELALLSNEIPSIDNLFVSYLFDEKDCSIKMLYEVKHGVCDQKFGIHVAKMVQFPQEMVTFAQEKVRKYELSENPPNKPLLDKIGDLIIQKTQQLNLENMNEEDLLQFLIKTASEVS